MTDLVKQLRQKDFKVVNEKGYTEIGYRWGPLFEKAADRIDKLEVALRYIQEKAFADRDDPSQLYILYQNDYVDLDSYIDEVMKEELGNDK